MNSIDLSTHTGRADSLRGLCGGAVHLPGAPGYDAARTPWNVAADLRPAAVAVPRDASDVADVMHAALDAGLRVAPMSTGHAAALLTLDDLADVVVVRMSGLTGVTVDPDARTARVEGGTLWQDVVEAAAAHGLAALHGSSPDVAVAGYCLGGGIGWYARKHGFAADSVLAVELVTPNGELLRADAEHHADLFWALRGGGGNFGVVTALEIRLLPFSDAYAGMLLWDREAAPEVLRTWARWTATAPDEVTTSLRVMSFPPLPELPPFLSGRQLVVVDGALLADDAVAEELLAPLRALGPEMDTFARVPVTAVTRIHMDPEGAAPSAADHTLLADLPEEAIEAFLAQVGPGTSTSLLAAELRQLSGALSRRTPDGGAIGATDAAFAAFLVGIAPVPEAVAGVKADAARVVAALEPWSAARELPTFAEHGDSARRCYSDADWDRLRALRAQVDPGGRMRAGHVI
ncbi:FAD-binding oxidoreductase [Nocardioides sp.]|uniref:FAD-binding oxidoreductase n=1 Tax=Nocardioides sp. TaxID=35761 RepID=UPI0035B33B5A